MLENLKIVIRKQKKLLLLFFLTIFIPSVTLSIFALRAIRNERFRLAEQVENDHRRTADLLKSQISARIENIDLSLQSLASHPSFLERDFIGMNDLISSRTAGESLFGQVVIVYKSEETLFPLFQSLKTEKDDFPFVLSPNQRALLSEAAENEYKLKNYRRAIAIYERLFSSGGNGSFKAEMLINKGRCLMRSGAYTQALQIYTRILEDYPSSISSSGLPLELAAELQILECYRKLNNPRKFLESAIKLYRDILQEPWKLSRDQYNLYSSMTESELAEALAQPQYDAEKGLYESEFLELKERHRNHQATWEEIEIIKYEIVPELKRMLDSPRINSDLTIHRSLFIDEEEFLLIGAWILEKSGLNPQGILVAEIDEESFKTELLNPVLSEYLKQGDMNVIISKIQGEELIGKTDPKFPVSTLTAFFEENFPPWKIDFFRTKAESSSLKSLSKNFYFWTILTLFIILTFGGILITRTLSQEMEVLKVKSDFVSSVSHELKTPLTSIKALIERLKEGKVKGSDIMMEYFSLISNDTEKLTRLVKNILDFSKIEEGKMEYEFEETDIPALVRQELEAFQQDEIYRDVKMRVHIAENVPPIQTDSSALARAFCNLLNNAVKFSPENPDISVGVIFEKGNIIISVKDKGIGIPEDEIDKIFDKFYQGKNSHELTVKGTGLGLTLVKHIAEAHEGWVSVKSKQGAGSTFSLILPYQQRRKGR
jgi:signal transduction histidine kinase/tetratricopeptide (TPR) repeat protein